MNKVKISCITPTFNRAHLLKNAIESTIAQTYPEWEMIIIDDGSTDNTEEVVKSYIKQEKRIKYFKNPGKGANAARNFGIMKSEGEFIAFLDDDDENLPHRFESQLNAVKKSGCNFILSGYQVKHINGKIVSKKDKGLWAKGAGITSRWFIKKNLLFEAGLFDENMPSMQEGELSYRIAEITSFANHKDIVVTERQTPGSLSRGKNKIIGKIMLIEKHHDKLHPLEAAWWYYIIGVNFHAEGDKKKSIKYLKTAAELDTRGIYKMALAYARIFFNFDFILKRINGKVLNILSLYRFPKLVDHPIVF